MRKLSKNQALTKILGIKNGDRVRVLWKGKNGKSYYRYGYVEGSNLRRHFIVAVRFDRGGLHYVFTWNVELACKRERR